MGITNSTHVFLENFPVSRGTNNLQMKVSNIFSATFVNSQLFACGKVGSLTVVIVVFCRFVDCVSVALKSPPGEWSINPLTPWGSPLTSKIIWR